MNAPVSERVYELRRERRHGASWMARRALEALIDVARDCEADSSEALFDGLLAAASGLARARPEVGAIAGAVGRVLAPARLNLHLDADELRRLVEEEANALVAARDRAARSIAIQLRTRLTDASVFTHSASATVREALLYTRPKRVACTVSAPNEEGRAFAEELAQAGLAVELIDDEAGVDAVAASSLLLVGADTVFADGSLYNKIGTRLLAQAARAAGIPVVVAAEVIKLAPVDATAAPELEPEATELFDLTPAELVDDVVTEEGTFASGEVVTLVPRVPFLAEGYALLAAAR
jgi:translation initiation factor 2B subunit (eIF-2B alpha/beta/delta family)